LKKYNNALVNIIPIMAQITKAKKISKNGTLAVIIAPVELAIVSKSSVEDAVGI